MNALGWVVWWLGMLVGIIITGTYLSLLRVENNMGRRRPCFYAAITQWFLQWWTFVFPEMNKLHLLWLVPFAFQVATWFAIRRQWYRAVYRLGTWQPPALVAVALFLGPILYLLTFR